MITGKYCPKWWCRGTLTRTPKRTCISRAAVTTVIEQRCPKCGWHQDDYEIADVPGSAQPHQRDKAKERERSRRRRSLKAVAS
jgi:hypothetical protein